MTPDTYRVPGTQRIPGTRCRQATTQQQRAAVATAGFTLALVVPHAVGDWSRLATPLLYGLASVWLFVCSAIYHMITRDHQPERAARA